MKKFITKALLLFFVITLNVIACKKNDSIEQRANNFGITQAKEWWYGTFRKSTGYTLIDWESPLAPPAGSSTKKYPKWKSAISYKKDDLEIVEMPLVYETNNIYFPGMQYLNNSLEGGRIAKASIHKLLIIKNGEGIISVRIATIIPSVEFAKANNYDISYLSSSFLPDDFTGAIIIAEWDETEINIIKVLEPRKAKKLHVISNEEFLKIRPGSENGVQARQVCEAVWVPNLVWVCVVIPSDDDLADQEQCEQNGHWAENGWNYELVCYEVEDNPEDPCALYGIGCSGGSGDGGGTGSGSSTSQQLEQFDDNIRDSLSHPCLSDILDSIKALQGGKIGEIIFKLSQNVPSWDWKLIEGPTTIGVAETFDFYPNGSVTVFDFDKISNYTELAIVRLMLHESVHAFLLNYFHNDPAAAQMDYPQLFEYYNNTKDTAIAQHQLMGDSLVNSIADALQNYGQNNGYDLSYEVYHDIAWGGLYSEYSGVAAFNRLTPFERERIRSRNSAENSSTPRDGQYPTRDRACQ